MDVAEGNNVWRAFRYVVVAAKHSPDMGVPLLADSEPPLALYTDASDEQGCTRFGAKLLARERLPRIRFGAPQWRTARLGASRTRSSTRPSFMQPY